MSAGNILFFLFTLMRKSKKSKTTVINITFNVCYVPEADNLQDDQINLTTDRIDSLSLTLKNEEIRQQIYEQYATPKYKIRDESYEGSDDESSESDISELSLAGQWEVEQRLNSVAINKRKSNLFREQTPTTWNDNELSNLQNEIGKELASLQSLSSQPMDNQNDFINNNKIISIEKQPNLFRLKSTDKWNYNDLQTAKHAMQEQ
eukprot:554459_1